VPKIVHIDMDAFYASVEMRDNPSLRNKPLAVGGRADGRGVVATANYIARKFGVKSGTPSWQAKKLCPDIVIMQSDFDKYREESRAIHEIFGRFTDLIEPLSLDEAFLDVSDSMLMKGSATLIAKEIRRLIKKERGLTASAGVAPNKFLAKVASDWNKPDGQFVITPDDVDNFIRDLPVEKIFGVGKASTKVLFRHGIYTCGDIQKTDLLKLERIFGSRGAVLYQLAHGIDNRPVETEHIRRSISTEDTFSQDLTTLKQCAHAISEIFDTLMRRYAKIQHEYSIKKLFVKIKFSDFTITTVEDHHLIEPSVENFCQLLATGWRRKKLPVRLIGLGFRLFHAHELQLSLW
jgi:DNA polymerase-4